MTNDRTHEFKLLGSYMVPRIELSVNGFFRAMSGRPYTPFAQYTNGLLNAPTTYRQPYLEPRGSRRRDSDMTLDLRFEKTFGIGGDKIGLFMDILNVFNADTITTVETPRAEQDDRVGAGHDDRCQFRVAVGAGSRKADPARGEVVLLARTFP